MDINALKYKLLEVDLEDIKTTISNNPYRVLSSIGIAGLTAKQIQQNKREKQGKSVNKHQNYEEPADDLSITLANNLYPKKG